MTADVELLPCPFCGGTSTLTDKDSPICPVGHILCDDCYASADSTRWNQRATAAKDAEIEALRADKLDLEAALESLKSHKELAIMNQNGVIKALSEVRDEQGAEIHRLRAELVTAKGQAEFYRTTRNWSQQKAERLAEALRDLLDNAVRRGVPEDDHSVTEAEVALRDHDQEGE